MKPYFVLVLPDFGGGKEDLWLKDKYDTYTEAETFGKMNFCKFEIHRITSQLIASIKT